MIKSAGQSKRESIGSELLARLERIAHHLTETTDGLEAKLDKISEFAPPQCEPAKEMAVREYPVYFNSFRDYLDQLEAATARISMCIDRCEI